ncbi:hypothetical protein HDU67_009358, partial [Dinochytrium kinnereticum]
MPPQATHRSRDLPTAFAVAVLSAIAGTAIGFSLSRLIQKKPTPTDNDDSEASQPVEAYKPSQRVVEAVDSLPIVRRLKSIVPPLEYIPFRPLLTDVMVDEANSHQEEINRKKKTIASKDVEDPNAFSDQLIRGRTLYGHGRIEYSFGMYSREEKTLVKVVRLGDKICGHSGLVHGGMIAALFDDFMGSVFFTNAQGAYTGFTANLTIDYRYPVPAPSTVILILWIESHEGRKVFIR